MGNLDKHWQLTALTLNTYDKDVGIAGSTFIYYTPNTASDGWICPDCGKWIPFGESHYHLRSFVS